MRIQSKRFHSFDELPDRDRLFDLTPKQVEVLRLVSQGKANIEIAEELGVEEKTIENHRYNIGCKLDLKGRNKLYQYSLKVFIIDK